MRVGCLWALGALGASWDDAHAQEATASIALGAARVAFAEQPAFTSTTLSPAVTLRSALAALTATATFAQVDRGAWSTQGTVQGSLFSPVSARGVMLEAAGSYGGSSFPGGVRTAQGLGAARAHWLNDFGSVWIGAAAGAMYDGAQWRDVRQAEFAATVAMHSQRVTLMVTPSRTDDTLRYTDLLALYGTAWRGVDVTASLGGRSGATLPIVGGDRRLWGGVELQWWWRPRVSVSVAAGGYPVDVTQGFPAGQYVSLGMRLGDRRSLTATEQAEARATRATARAIGLEAFQWRVADDGSVAIRVRADGAQRVEIVSDLTRWAPRALARGSDGWWWIRIPRSGATVIELALRLDGGAWVVPPGAAPLRDEFGGLSGRLVLTPEL